MAAGYSGTPLAKKLGVKPGNRLNVVGAPSGYRELLAPLPEGADVVEGLPRRGPAGFLHFFTAEKAILERELPGLKGLLASDGILWISWPKKAARVATDVDGNVVRAAGLSPAAWRTSRCAPSTRPGRA